MPGLADSSDAWAGATRSAPGAMGLSGGVRGGMVGIGVALSLIARAARSPRYSSL
jgi:hypothetical protein